MIGAYTRGAGLVLVLVMSFHLVVGVRLLCARQLAQPAEASGNDRATLATTSGESGGGTVGVVENSGNRGRTIPCSWKKHKKCPTFPRAAMTWNPTHRFNEIQRKFRLVCCDSFVSHVSNHSFSSKVAPPFTELEWRAPLYSATLLAITCVLLI
jgi:hypothetical protein